MKLSFVKVSCISIMLFLSSANLLAEGKDIYNCFIDGQWVFQNKPCEDNPGKKVELKHTNIVDLDNYVPDGFYNTEADRPKGGHGTKAKLSGWMSGASGYDRALSLSKNQGKPILVYVHTNWCGWCRKLEAKVLSNSSVKKQLRHFIKVEVNPDESKSNRKLIDRWGVRGYPSLMIQRKPEGSLSRMSHAYEPDKFINKLNRYVK